VSSLLGATHLGDGRTDFLVWAPKPERVELHLLTPTDRIVEMATLERGYRHAVAAGIGPGATYRFRLDGEDLPDPASRFQPKSVHGPSAVIDPRAFRWDDAGWTPPPLADYVIYELHVGTYTPEGTLEAIVPHLDDLVALGVTAVELMPIGQFPGDRNWGYDGVFPYAVQDSYGGPSSLAFLVNECHRRGLAVVLDVVYNHIGPEGNVLDAFGPYFTGHYRTPWGPAMNFDGPGSDEVRRYFVENALRWSDEFHIDALRLDAIQGIFDASARPFLEELAQAADANARPLLLIAETDQNDRRVVTPRERGGLGVHAQWSDDFHHSMHALLTGEQRGVYEDFGSLEQLATAYREGFVYSGQFSPFRGRRFGSSSEEIPGEKLVVFAQNHDQVGNRFLGERLSRLVDLETAKLAAGLTVLAPYVPLLFMGEEYGELAPFNYFVSHSAPELVENVRHGRREEHAAFGWVQDPHDPQDEATFEISKLEHRLKQKEPHRSLLALYRELLHLKKMDPALRVLDKHSMDVQTQGQLLMVHRWSGSHQVQTIFNLGQCDEFVGEKAQLVLDSADARFGGPGPGSAIRPRAFHIYEWETDQ
jgi:maltooligosyltrehalose trehalohydrolase